MRVSLLNLAMAVSLTANLCLVSWLLWPTPVRFSPAREQPAFTHSPPLVSPPFYELLEAPPNSDSAPQFHWDQVESRDLATYASNLKRAGFPDEAVRDALLPLVDQAYAAALSEHAKFALAPRWAEPAESVKRSSAAAIDQAQKTRQEQLKHVFGLEEHEVQGYQPWEFQARQEDLPWVEDAARKRLQEMKKQRSDFRQSLKAKGVRDAELDEAMRPFVLQQEAELPTFLPADAVEKLISVPR